MRACTRLLLFVGSFCVGSVVCCWFVFVVLFFLLFFLGGLGGWGGGVGGGGLPGNENIQKMEFQETKRKVNL